MFFKLRGGAIVTPPHRIQHKKRKTPPVEKKEELVSHPITTIWFFYREMLYRIETSKHHESYSILLQFVERWIRNWKKPFSSWNETARYLGVLEAFLLGVFPVYSRYSKVMHLRIPAVDVEDITSTFAVAFLGKPHFHECEELITSGYTRVMDCIALGTKPAETYTLENFYETYSTILARVFYTGKPAPLPRFIAKLSVKKKKLQQTKRRSTPSPQKGTRKTGVKATVARRRASGKTHRRGIGSSSKTMKNRSSTPLMTVEE
jgi:hypothetical protein